MITPPQDYAQSEFARLIKQPRPEWNVEAIVDSEQWSAELPIIPFLNPFPQPTPDNTNMYVEVEAEDIRFPARTFNIDLVRSFTVTAESAIETEFRSLAHQWKQDTNAMSSVSDIVMHPAYQRIMAMGKPALRFILEDLRDHYGDWFHALHYIAGVDIAASTETVEDAKSAWLDWGYSEGYI
jgi:hypothetical protein